MIKNFKHIYLLKVKLKKIFSTNELRMRFYPFVRSIILKIISKREFVSFGWTTRPISVKRTINCFKQ